MSSIYSMGNIRLFHLFKSIVFAVFFLLTVVLFGVGDAYAESTGAVLKIVPASGTFYVDKTFDVSVVLDTGSQSVNAVAAELRFPPDTIQITNPAAGSSIISLWSSPPTYSNSDGIVRLQGGIPSPGIKTSQGVVTTFTFRAMRPGTASILFTGNSQVLANDGQGTDILSLTIGASYKIDLPPPEGPAVSSPTHPSQNAWYKSTSPTVQWIKEEGVTDFAWSLDQDAGGIAKVTEPKGPETSTSYEGLEDGFWYFHIRAKKGETWGGVTTFLIRIDSTDPADFKVEFAPGEVTNDRRPFVNFVTSDALSGINRYEVRLVPTSGENTKTSDGISSFFIAAQSPYRFSELEVGGYDVIVRAYDNAGNISETIGHIHITSGAIALVSSGIKFGPWFIPWWSLSIVGILFVLVGIFIFRHYHGRYRHLQRRVSDDVVQMRTRLKRDFSDVSERLAEEEHLKKDLEQQLKRLEEFETKQQGKISVLFMFVFALTALFLSFAGIINYAQVNVQQNIAAASEPETISEVPVITTFRGRISSEELLYFGGTAPPNSVVVLSLAQEQQEPLVVESRVDDLGRWSYLHSRFLQPGVYKVFARAQFDDGTSTDWGPQISIEVISNTVSVGGLNIPFQHIIGFTNLLLIVIAFGLGGASVALNTKHGQLRKRLQKEVREAENAVQEGFRILRSDMEKELELVGAAEFPSRKLTHEEKISRQQLVADLQAIEARVQKEVEDIEQAF